MSKFTTTAETALATFLKNLDPNVDKNVTDAGLKLLDSLKYRFGYESFLKTLGKSTFSKPFAPQHTQFWEWYWRVTKKRVMGIPLSKETLAFIAAWSRGAGKSSSVEWACITEGAVGLDGYVLYVSLTQDSANKHVLDIRDRIEGEQIADTFPHLSNPKMGVHGNRYAWNQEFLVTQGGWAIRPVGLDVAVRGLRLGDIRPTLIVLDDIDKFNSSVGVVRDAIDTIARSILPAGTKDTIILVAQNLIYENSIVNQIVTNKIDLLADRIESIYPAFKPDTLKIDTRIEEDTGKTVHIIDPQSEPWWVGMDLESCQRFLNNSGLEAFFSEYQHDFTLDQQDKVIPEFKDYPTHVISWSQFEEKFGVRNRVPSHWQTALGLDIGYSTGHLSAWTWLAVGAQDSKLPNAHFVYRGKTFEGVSIDDQAQEVLSLMTYTDELGHENSEAGRLISMKISHERTGEQKILNGNYGFNFSKCSFRKEDGIPQWRNLLRVDKHQPHPFHHDLQKEDGTWTYGRPNMFYVVDDDQLTNPRDDRGLAIHRAQTANWKRRRVTVTNTGLQEALPMKWEDDANDSTRMLVAEAYLSSTPLTMEQRVNRQLSPPLRSENIQDALGQEDYGQILMARQMAVEAAEAREREKMQNLHKMLEQMKAPTPTSRLGKNRRKRRSNLL